MKKEFSLARLLPVMFGFFIMGFVDIIGVGTSNVKADFSSLSDTQANLLSLSCFFLVSGAFGADRYVDESHRAEKYGAAEFPVACHSDGCAVGGL